MKRLHLTECLSRDLAIKSSQAYQTNLIKPDKWNQLNVVTDALLDVALTASNNMCILSRDTCSAFEEDVGPMKLFWSKSLELHVCT